MFFLSVFLKKGKRVGEKQGNQLQIADTLFAKSIHNLRVYYIRFYTYFGSRIAQGKIISSIEMPPCWNPPLNWCL